MANSKKTCEERSTIIEENVAIIKELEEKKTAIHEKEKYNKLYDDLINERRNHNKRIKRARKMHEIKTCLIMHCAILPNWVLAVIILIKAGVIKEQLLGFVNALRNAFHFGIIFPFRQIYLWSIKMPLPEELTIVIGITGALMYFLILAIVLFYVGTIVNKSFKAFHEDKGYHQCRYICANVAIFLAIFDIYNTHLNVFMAPLIMWLLYFVYLYISDWWRVRSAYRNGDYSCSREIKNEKGDLFLFSWIIRKIRKDRK